MIIYIKSHEFEIVQQVLYIDLETAFKIWWLQFRIVLQTNTSNTDETTSYEYSLIKKIWYRQYKYVLYLLSRVYSKQM